MPQFQAALHFSQILHACNYSRIFSSLNNKDCKDKDCLCINCFDFRNSFTCGLTDHILLPKALQFCQDPFPLHFIKHSRTALIVTGKEEDVKCSFNSEFPNQRCCSNGNRVWKKTKEEKAEHSFL